MQTMTIGLGQFVKITGGTTARGKVGQVSDLDDSVFVGVRIPNIGLAKETVYVTRGSVVVVGEQPAGRDK